MEQKILTADKNYAELDAYFINSRIKNLLLVCGNSFKSMKLSLYVDTLKKRLGVNVAAFSEFKPNPTYESVVKGVAFFQKHQCDAILAVGGGSAMDVAKCIKLYTNMDSGKNYLEQKIVPNNIPLLAVPTTAGTGSEATRFAVIYYKGEKQSVADDSCIPSVVLIDPSVLETLPDYHRKCTMLDAFCHALESYWSVNSTEKSKAYSKEAIKLLLENKDAYLSNDPAGNALMLRASNLAGKAINITQTTAGHAMCYKLTSLYHIAHGHAAALCVEKLWPYMITHTHKCVDLRGEHYLKSIFEELAAVMGCSTSLDAASFFQQILVKLALPVPDFSEEDIPRLTASVNPVRLKNNPVVLDTDTITSLYREILHRCEEREDL